MQKINFPFFEEHKKQHEAFIAQVTSEVQNFEKEALPDHAGFVKYLMNWILNHIANSDKKITPYLAALGEKK